MCEWVGVYGRFEDTCHLDLQGFDVNEPWTLNTRATNSVETLTNTRRGRVICQETFTLNMHYASISGRHPRFCSIEQSFLFFTSLV